MSKREDRKYAREENINADKYQLKLDTLKPTTSLRAKEIISLDPDTFVICPFCLYRGKLQEFIISTKKGFHRGLGKCPDCKLKSQIRTLVNLPRSDPEQYAEFVFNYVSSGFWDKVSPHFNKWRERLKQSPEIYSRFWAKYYQLRGDKQEGAYYDRRETDYTL